MDRATLASNFYDNSQEVVFTLATCGANLNLKNSEGNSPILIYLKGNWILKDAMKMITGLPINIFQSNEKGESVFSRLTKKIESTKTLDQLISKYPGPKRALKKHIKSAIISSLESRNYIILSHLIDNHWNKNDIKNLINEKVFVEHVSVHNSNDYKNILSKYNVDVNKKDKNGNTPLHIACKNKSEEVVKHLVNSGADVNAKNKEGNLPIH